MGKQRNSDTEIWRDPWHRKLEPKYKCFWRYICDNCDDSGVWKIDMELANFQIGETLYIEDVLKNINSGKERIKHFKEGYLFITGFLEFHYPSGLSLASGFHKKITGLIRNHGLEGLNSPYLGVKDISKDKGKGKDIRVFLEKPEKPFFEKPSLNDLKSAFETGGLEAASALVEAHKFLDYYESVGWVVGRTRKPMKSWRGALSTWLRNRAEDSASALKLAKKTGDFEHGKSKKPSKYGHISQRAE